jgi:uncharacterized protein (TIGR02246 family)
MKIVWLVSLSTVCLLGLSAGAQQTADREADERAIRAVVDAFIATRDANDAEALAALLTPDVDQHVTSGALRVGRQAVVEDSIATTNRTGGRREIRIETIRFVSDDVAIVDGAYDILGRRDGTDRHYRTTMILLDGGSDWQIAAIRNMQPTN